LGSGFGNAAKSGEKVRVTVDLNQIVTSSHHAGEVMRNEEFVVVLRPHIGSVLDISRVAPAEVTEVNDLG
jgi:archaellin